VFRFLATLFRPRHSFGSVVRELVEGLRDGSIRLDRQTPARGREGGDPMVDGFEARVRRVVVHENGAGELRLADVPGPAPGGRKLAAEVTLFFPAAPGDVAALEGRVLAVGPEDVTLGGTKVAEREGYSGIRFTVKSLKGL
jgi:hypothetical protein